MFSSRAHKMKILIHKLHFTTVTHFAVLEGFIFPFFFLSLFFSMSHPPYKPLSHRDGGALWAAVYGVAQSWTRLK